MQFIGNEDVELDMLMLLTLYDLQKICQTNAIIKNRINQAKTKVSKIIDFIHLHHSCELQLHPTDLNTYFVLLILKLKMMIEM